MRARTTKLITNVVLALAMAAACLASAHGAGDTPPIAQECCRDLAKRLSLPVDAITVHEAKATDWPNAALGLPRPDEMYAQVVTPGWRLILEAKSSWYLYCTSDRNFRYGGPVGAWSASALCLESPAEPDGNLNKDLYQISLAGTNPTLLIPYVDHIYPQADGSIIASRRTSRSGSDLLYLAPGEANRARKIGGAFDVGEAIVSPDGKLWYGLTKDLMQATWTLQATSLESSGAKPQASYDLPEFARPGQLILQDGRFYAHLYIKDKDGWYGFDPKNAAAGWEKLDRYSPPDPFSLMLNKSESLAANVTKEGDKPVTAVVRRWFTGEEHPVAKIDNFEFQKMALVGHRFALIWGQQDGHLAAFTVDLRTGEVLLTVAGPAELVLPFAAPPHGSPLA